MIKSFFYFCTSNTLSHSFWNWEGTIVWMVLILDKHYMLWIQFKYFIWFCSIFFYFLLTLKLALNFSSFCIRLFLFAFIFKYIFWERIFTEVQIVFRSVSFFYIYFWNALRKILLFYDLPLRLVESLMKLWIISH